MTFERILVFNDFFDGFIFGMAVIRVHVRSRFLFLEFKLFSPTKTQNHFHQYGKFSIKSSNLFNISKNYDSTSGSNFSSIFHSHPFQYLSWLTSTFLSIIDNERWNIKGNVSNIDGVPVLNLTRRGKEGNLTMRIYLCSHISCFRKNCEDVWKWFHEKQFMSVYWMEK